MGTTYTKRRIFFDMHFPEISGQNIAENFQPAAIAESMKAAHVDSVIAFAKCQFGNFYYNTPQWHKHTGLGSQDFLAEFAKELHKREIEIIGYISISWDEWQANHHPDWLVEDSQGQRGTPDAFRWRTLCLNSPYRAEVLNQVHEIASLPYLDGMWIDMSIIGEDSCHCHRCRKAFEDRFHRPLTPQEGPSLDFRNFRYDTIEAFYSEAYQRAREANPNLALTNNYWGYPFSSYSMGSRTIGALKNADYTTGEAYTDWTGILAPAIFSRFLRSLSKGRPFEALIGRFINTWDYCRKPFEQLEYECLTVFANGGCVTIDDEPYADGSIDEELYSQDIARIYGTMEQFASSVQGSPEKYLAIYHSLKSKDNCSEIEFIRRTVGAFKMAFDLSIPVEFVFDEQIASAEDLKPYAAILLPGVHCMDSEEKQHFADYAQAGGRIISFGGCGLFEEKGWAGIQDLGALPHSLTYKQEAIDAQTGRFITPPTLVRGEARKLHTTGTAQASGILLAPVCRNTKEEFFHNNLPAPGKAEISPILIQSTLGQGSIFAYSQPWSEHYAKYPAAPWRKTLAEALEGLKSPVVQIPASKRLDSVVYQQSNALVIHLMLASADPVIGCGLMDPMGGNFERPYEVVEEIQPMRDIVMTISSEQTPLTVRSLSGRTNPKIDGHTIRVDELRTWDALVVELA